KSENGKKQELKKALESYWKNNITKNEFLSLTSDITVSRYRDCLDAGIDVLACNDFSLYDFMLDTATMFGVIPERFRDSQTEELQIYFNMARGNKNAQACQMTKWFDTNYHYIVPEIENGNFKLIKNRPLHSFKFAEDKLKISTKPVLVGPFTFILLSKIIKRNDNNEIIGTVNPAEDESFRDLVISLAKQYNVLIKELEDEGVCCVQLDEPGLVLDRSAQDMDILKEAYGALTQGLTEINVLVNTYYEKISNYKELVFDLPVAGIGLDFVVNDENLKNIEKFGFPQNKKLLAGIVSGRDPWKTDLKKTVSLVNKLRKIVGDDNLVISNASPLFHLPCTIECEVSHLNPDIIKMLAFARERLDELVTVKRAVEAGTEIKCGNIRSIHKKFDNTTVQNTLSKLDEEKINRPHSFKDRYLKQNELLKLGLFPTTTIGSFPQTSEVRKMRSMVKSGKISKDEYDGFIKKSIRDVVALQEDIGLDVLVHGEFERTDMVEFFGQQMQGYAFTVNGWVQSYGSRCVRPPIIYGDIYREKPMTLDYILYADSLTEKPMKGMLTGPVTMVNWSFYRKDIPKKQVVYQVALALLKEVLDLEKAGIKIIQIDEPAFREGLPLKKSKHKNYLQWAVTAFRITNFKVQEDTQIHTHMCYSDFGGILGAIHAMDADVISMEASRSKGEVIRAFEEFDYDHGIGLGTYDIHSPRVPHISEMTEIVDRAVKVIDKSLFWINPDCGLKTRGYEETVSALKNMVQTAKIMRKKYA
ncbi:5-methyltetrahydropteroyltriglutamate--homocysteine S-methyltransferase, partial [bacterium]|nr:5-methyltetrahydropteroyltriglutamate--homocysteine S-methyltransferase [bacterium]